MTNSLHETLILFSLTLVDIFCLKFISHYIKEILYVNRYSKKQLIKYKRGDTIFTVALKIPTNEHMNFMQISFFCKTAISQRWEPQQIIKNFHFDCVNTFFFSTRYFGDIIWCIKRWTRFFCMYLSSIVNFSK